jgi:hypothetical protein
VNCRTGEISSDIAKILGWKEQGDRILELPAISGAPVVTEAQVLGPVGALEAELEDVRFDLNTLQRRSVLLETLGARIVDAENEEIQRKLVEAQRFAGRIIAQTSGRR